MTQESTETAARRKRIARMRAEGMTWPQIADAESITVTRCHQIVSGNPGAPNPDGEPREYACAACGRTFTSTTKWPPSRCRLCRSSNWKGAVTAALALVMLLAGSARADERPSFLLFVLDDATEAIITPRLAAIAGEGVRFTATAPSPLCGPSRASILTGLHTHNHGVKGNVGGEEEWAANAAGRTVGDWFSAAGYVTARFGKGINGVSRDALTGFAHAVNPVHSPGDPGGLSYLTDRAVELVAATPDPMFVYFAPVHDWSNPTPEYSGRYEGTMAPRPPSFDELDASDKRWKVQPPLTNEEVAAIDERHRRALETMEAMVDSIEALRAAFGSRPLYVAVVSDNGHEDGQHRFANGKGQHFEESIRVPLFVLGPGIEPAESPALVYPLDLAPTFAELAGVATPELDGRSLTPLFVHPDAPWRERVLLEHGFRGVRTAGRKLVLRGSARELYNLNTDPFELRNRCDVGETTCGSALEPFIAELRACRGASCWTAETRQGDDAP